jgi:hypothetical protein
MHWIDPDHLPETSGLVDRFLVNGEGEADGLVLADGTEVHFPPHMGQAILDAVRPGATVRVRGVRPRGVGMIAAVSIAPDEGDRIVDAGPSENDEDRKAHRKQAHTARSVMDAQGVVRQALHGPKGEVRGLLLEDGRAGRFPPHAAEAVAGLLVPGRPVLLRGDCSVTPHGTVIAVREIGTSADDLRALDTGKPHPKKHGDKADKRHKPSGHGLHAGEPRAADPL